MMEVTMCSKLRQLGHSYMANIDNLNSKFKRDIEQFLGDTQKKLLLFETRHLGLGVLRMRQVLAKLEGDCKRYLEDDNQIFVNWGHFINIVGSSEVLPKFPNLVVLDFESGTLEGRELEILAKLVERLSLGTSKKMVLISTQKGLFKRFLQKLDVKVYSEMDDSNCERILNIKKTASSSEAAATGQLNEVLKYIEEDADINQFVDDLKNTALHKAAEKGNKDVVLTLMQHGAKHQANKSGDTPLHLAAANGHTDVVVVLLEKNISVDIRGQYDKTPLHGAAAKGRNNVVLTLLEYCANVNATNDKKATPLHYAAQNGHNDVALTLLKYGAGINAKGNNKWTPLHYAAKRGQNTLVRTLKEHGSAVDCRNELGSTPLHLAAYFGNLETVKTLIEAGADFNSLNSSGRSVLDLAKNKKCDVAIIDFLTSKGAKLSDTDL